jgi:hypothetical protein
MSIVTWIDNQSVYLWTNLPDAATYLIATMWLTYLSTKHLHYTYDPAVLSIWSCTVKLAEEDSKYVGLTWENDFGSAKVYSLQWLVKVVATLCITWVQCVFGHHQSFVRNDGSKSCITWVQCVFGYYWSFLRKDDFTLCITWVQCVFGYHQSFLRKDGSESCITLCNVCLVIIHLLRGKNGSKSCITRVQRTIGHHSCF